MVRTKQAQWVSITIASVALALAVLLGVQLRLADPLSSPVIPAEDPYTHMAHVREHLRDGTLGSRSGTTSLYPPGLHSFLAAVWVFTGVELYDLFRWGPVLFGAIGILGMGLFLWRFDGPVAGVVGAFAFAMAPEVIFRTTMMAPTALDLAVLPFLFYALLQVLLGRLAWIGILIPLLLFLVIAHPWLVSVLALVGLAFAMFAFAIPWSASRGPPVSPYGLVAAVAIVGVGWGLALSGCGGICSGNPDTLAGGRSLSEFAPLLVVVAFLPAALLAQFPRCFRWLLPQTNRKALPLLVRLGIGVSLALLLVLATVPAIQQGMPRFVNLPRMFGWSILLMAALAFVALPFVASPAAHMGAAVVAATYPFVLYNPFQSSFLPHRTAVYLGVGLVLLTGVAAGAVARVAARALQDRRRTSTEVPGLRARPVMAAMPALLVVGLLGGVYVGTPGTYSWYRLFRACEFETLQEVSSTGDTAPSALIVTGDWQSKVVLAALTDNASRVWFKLDFFTSKSAREGVMAFTASQDRPIVAVVDGYLKAAAPRANMSFFQAPPWQPLVTSCNVAGTSHPSILAYIAPGDPP